MLANSTVSNLKISNLVMSLCFIFAACNASLLFAETTTATNLVVTEIRPIDQVQTTVEKLIEIVGKLPGETNAAARRGKLREVLDKVFDFEEMSKRSLGPQWKEASADQQVEFVRVFSDLLARTYLQKVEKIQPGMVKFDKELIELPRAVVKTLITSNGDVFPLDYKLLNSAAGWKVYDVVIENIGLVSNYRNEFSGIVRKEGFDGLLKRLQEKV